MAGPKFKLTVNTDDMISNPYFELPTITVEEVTEEMMSRSGEGAGHNPPIDESSEDNRKKELERIKKWIEDRRKAMEANKDDTGNKTSGKGAFNNTDDDNEDDEEDEDDEFYDEEDEEDDDDGDNVKNEEKIEVEEKKIVKKQVEEKTENKVEPQIIDKRAQQQKELEEQRKMVEERRKKMEEMIVRMRAAAAKEQQDEEKDEAPGLDQAHMLRMKVQEKVEVMNPEMDKEKLSKEINEKLALYEKEQEDVNKTINDDIKEVIKEATEDNADKKEQSKVIHDIDEIQPPTKKEMHSIFNQLNNIKK